MRRLTAATSKLTNEQIVALAMKMPLWLARHRPADAITIVAKAERSFGVDGVADWVKTLKTAVQNGDS